MQLWYTWYWVTAGKKKWVTSIPDNHKNTSRNWNKKTMKTVFPFPKDIFFLFTDKIDLSYPSSLLSKSPSFPLDSRSKEAKPPVSLWDMGPISDLNGPRNCWRSVDPRWAAEEERKWDLGRGSGEGLYANRCIYWKKKKSKFLWSVTMKNLDEMWQLKMTFSNDFMHYLFIYF